MGCMLLCLHQLGMDLALIDATHQDLSQLASIHPITGQVPVHKKGPL